MKKEYKSITSKQKRYLVIKRLIDIFASFIGIVLLLIPMLIIAIITRLTSKGPAIYKQERYGKNLKVFNCLKFRSMRSDAPQIAPSDMPLTQHDALCTKWGRFMRKLSIDEWPQLFNIFIGQMSFIGPRPGSAHNEEPLKEERLNQEYDILSLRPGLTGYAQVLLNRDHDPIKKAKLDNDYIKNISFKLDTTIFIKTIFGTLKGK